MTDYNSTTIHLHQSKQSTLSTILPKGLSTGMAIALLSLMTACQPTDPSNSEQSSGNGLKLGTLLPITGDLAQYGGPMQDTASLLTDTVNACGGVLGEPIALISEDNQTEPAAGASAMTKLTEIDQVTGVIGAAASSVSSASVDIAVRNKVIQISPASTSPVFTDRAKAGEFNGFWFRTAPPDTFQGVALANLVQSKGFTNVALLAINNDYGNGLVESFSTAYEALGGTIANGEDPTLYAPDATTFDSEVLTAFSGDPDAIILMAYPETGSLILKAAFEQGLLDDNTPLLLTDGMKNGSIPELVGKTTDGSYIVSGVIGTAPSAEGPALDRFTQLYQSAFGDREPGVFDPNTWDAAAVLVLAAEAAQSTDGTVVKETIIKVANTPGTEVTDVCEGLKLVRQGEDINYQGASGTIEFNEHGDVIGRYDIWTFTNDGTLDVLETVDAGG